MTRVEAETRSTDEAEAEPIFYLQGGVTPGPDLVTATTHPQRVKRVGSLWQNTETGKQRPVVKRGLKKKGKGRGRVGVVEVKK